MALYSPDVPLLMFKSSDECDIVDLRNKSYPILSYPYTIVDETIRAVSGIRNGISYLPISMSCFIKYVSGPVNDIPGFNIGIVHLICVRPHHVIVIVSEAHQAT